MTRHKTGTREQWHAARLDLLQAEKELTRLNDDLARRRRELPWVRLDKDYCFDTESGEATIAGLFTSLATTIAKRMFGYIQAGVYRPGRFRLDI